MSPWTHPHDKGHYFGAAVAVFVALWFLFRALGVDRKRLWSTWFTEPLLLLFWPICAVLSVMGLLIGLSDRKVMEKKTRGKAEALKNKTPYSDLSMDELLLAQRRALEELQTLKQKSTG